MINSSKIRLVTLSENTASRPEVLSEWGLSILVEVEGLKVLLDTGLTTSVVNNVNEMGIDLATLNKIVISHGHCDHTGGLRSILSRVRKEIDVIAHPEIWTPKYAEVPWAAGIKYVGIPFKREELEGLGARFILSSKPTWITEDIVVSGEVPMITSYEKVAPNLFIKDGDKYIHDEVPDDQSLFIKTDRGLVIVAGCAHRGIINIIHYAQKLTGEQRVDTVLGGIHLFRAPREQVDQTIAELKSFRIKRLGVSHCTGLEASCRLRQEMGDIFFFNNAGTKLEL